MNEKNDIQFEEPRFEQEIDPEVYTTWVDRVLDELEFGGSYISVFFTGEKTIQELNKQYLNKEYVTDVLSFSQVEGDQVAESSFLGDIVICVPYAENQARELGHSTKSELQYLMLHGILHLLGYDHDEKEDGEMSELERKVFSKLTGEILD